LKSSASQIKWWQVVVRFVLIFIPVALISGMAIYYIYRMETDTRIAKIKHHEQQSLSHLEHEIHHEFASIIADLFFLNEHHEMHRLIDNKPDARGDLEEDWVSFSKQRGDYDHIRFITKSGQEDVRGNYHNGKPYTVDSKDLQNKSGRYYFAATLQLGKNEIYISPFDLNIEQGKIEAPIKPMIRFGTPFFNNRGEKQGIVLLNYLGSNLISHLRDLEINIPTPQPMLINSDGFWLYAGEPELEWGIMYGNDNTFDKTYPDVWAKMQQQEQGQYVTDQGLLTSPRFGR